MPRKRNPSNEVGRSATERYRRGLAHFGGVETCAVDTAIAAAVAMFRNEAFKHGSAKNVERIEGLERLAIGLLVSRGKDLDRSTRAVYLRTRRSDIDRLVKAASTYAPRASDENLDALSPLLPFLESKKNIS